MKLLFKTMVQGRRSKRRRSPATNLTDDLIVEILTRLPPRSVCRFKCVSTTWRDLISANSRKLPQSLAGIFTMHDAENMMGSVPHFTNFLGRDCPLPLVSPWFDFLPANRVYLVDCCNGLILCNYWPRPAIDGCKLIVCNPATKKWVELPDSNLGNRPRYYFLAFDPTVSPHFYVFGFFRDHDQDFNLLVAGVEVYSSETGQWVRMEDNGISSPSLGWWHVFLNNGRMHYLTNDPAIDPAIAVVDTQGKVCHSIPVPDNKDYGFIHQSQGRLYYANFEADDKDMVIRFVVYVLEDYDSQRWTLKHTAEAFDVLGRESHNHVRDFRWGDFRWVAIHPDCNMIFYTVGWDKTLMSYDMDRRQVQVICTLGEDTREVCLPYVPLFSELEALHI